MSKDPTKDALMAIVRRFFKEVAIGRDRHPVTVSIQELTGCSATEAEALADELFDLREKQHSHASYPQDTISSSTTGAYRE